MPMPVSFLVDKDGQLRVVYKGMLKVDQVKKDLQTLDEKGRNAMALSIPFPGRWSEEHLDGNPIAVARVYAQDGAPDDAAEFLEHYLEITKPSGLPQEKLDRQTTYLRAASYYELATMAFRSKQPDQGFAYCQQALKLAPNSVGTLLAIIKHLANTGEYEKALPYCVSAEKLAGDNSMVNFQIGRIELGRKNWQAAVDHFDKAFQTTPKMLTAGNNLAWLLSTSPDETVRDGKRAVEIAESICAATQYKDYRFFGTLAAAYAEHGDFKNAVAITNKEIQLATARGDQESVVSLKQKLKQFESEKPVRD